MPAPRDAVTPEVLRLVDVVERRAALGAEEPPSAWTRDALAPGNALYANVNERLGIEFTVDRLAFPELQTMDPRVVRIPPGRCNERHRHAHESLFVILEGQGEVLVGAAWSPVRKGDVLMNLELHERIKSPCAGSSCNNHN